MYYIITVVDLLKNFEPFINSDSSSTYMLHKFIVEEF